MMQERLKLDSSSGGGEKWTDSGILKTDSKQLADGLDEECEQKRGVKSASKVLSGAKGWNFYSFLCFTLSAFFLHIKHPGTLKSHILRKENLNYDTTG